MNKFDFNELERLMKLATYHNLCNPVTDCDLNLIEHLRKSLPELVSEIKASRDLVERVRMVDLDTWELVHALMEYDLAVVKLVPLKGELWG